MDKTVKASELYKRGIELEAERKFDEALQYYRMALHLDPDLDERGHYLDGKTTSDIETSLANLKLDCSSNEDKNGKCKFLMLPTEIMAHACAYLDVYCVYRLMPLVCWAMKRISVCDLIWKEKCIRKYGCAIENSPLPPPTSDCRWLSVFCKQTFLRQDGVYVSRCTYFREVRDEGNIHHVPLGVTRNAKSCTQADLELLKQQIKKPFITISYCRLLKFMTSTSQVCVLRTNEPLQQAVTAVKNTVGHVEGCKECGKNLCATGRNVAVRNLQVGESVQLGRYTFDVLSKMLNIDYEDVSHLLHYHWRLKLAPNTSGSNPLRSNMKLVWQLLWAHSARLGTGEEELNLVDDSSHFKPFYFSKVRTWDYMY